MRRLVLRSLPSGAGNTQRNTKGGMWNMTRRSGHPTGWMSRLCRSKYSYPNSTRSPPAKLTYGPWFIRRTPSSGTAPRARAATHKSMKPKSDSNNTAGAVAQERLVRHSLPVSMKDLLHYEICAAWWPQFVSWGPLQDIIAGHFTRKVVKKYRRWKWCVERSQRLSDLIPPNAKTEGPPTETSNEENQ
jgi:hypothetical protein